MRSVFLSNDKNNEPIYLLEMGWISDEHAVKRCRASDDILSILLYIWYNEMKTMPPRCSD